MKTHTDAAEILRLRRELEMAREQMAKAIAHRDSMQRDLDAMSGRLTRRINHNNEIWNAAAKMPGGLEALRAVPWTG